jgi:hypothetical protein
VAERPDGGGVDVTGSEEGGEVAHCDRRGTGMLNLPLVGEGAHGGDDNSSPMLLTGLGTC